MRCWFPYYGADVHVNSPQPDSHQLTLPYSGFGLVHRVVSRFTPQLSLEVSAPTHGGMARLS